MRVKWRAHAPLTLFPNPSCTHLVILGMPLGWWGVSMLVFLLVAYALTTLMGILGYQAAGTISMNLRVDRRISVKKMKAFLQDKDLQVEDRFSEGSQDIVRVEWTETDAREWGGAAPVISFEYDEKNAFLLHINLLYERRKADAKLRFNAGDLKKRLYQELGDAKLWDDNGEGDDDSGKDDKSEKAEE